MALKSCPDVAVKLNIGLVDVAPAPVIAGLKRLNQRVASFPEVLCCVFVLRRVATPALSASQAKPKLNPPIASSQALLTAFCRWSIWLDLIEMSLVFRHVAS